MPWKYDSKQEPEHSMFTKQHLVIFVIHGLLSTVPWNTLKLEKKVAYYIRTTDDDDDDDDDDYYPWITAVKMMEYCLEMMLLRLYFSFLKLRLAVCGRVCRLCSIWFHLCQWKIGANGYDLCLRKSISDPGNMIFRQIL